MAGDALKKVTSGQRLRVPAAAYNAFVDAAMAVQGGMFSGGAGCAIGGGMDRQARVLVRNDSGSDVPQFGVLELAGLVISPTDNEAQFRDCPVFTGAKPGADGKPCVIAAEPIATGKLGQCVASGVTPIRLDVQDTAHACACATNGIVAKLKSAAAGPARILWKAGSSGEQWAVVCLHQGVAAAAAVPVRPWTIFVRNNGGTLQFCVCNSADCQLNPPPGGLAAGGMQQATAGGGNVFDLVPWLPWTTLDPGGVKVVVRNTLYGQPPADAGTLLAQATLGAILLEARTAAWQAPDHYEKDSGSSPPAWARVNLLVGSIPAPAGGVLPVPVQVLDRNLLMADFGLWWPW